MNNRIFSSIERESLIGVTRVSIILTLLYFSLSSNALGQNNELRNEIFGYNTSTKDLVEKGRLLLRDEVFKGNRVKANAIMQLMMVEQNDVYLFLTPAEEIALLYWLNLYDNVPDLVLQEELTLSAAVNQSRVIPRDNTLLTTIRNKLITTHDEQVKAMEASSSLPPMIKKFLELHLYYVTFDTRFNIVQDYLNDEADKFLKAYPDSRFQYFIQQNIRVKYIRSRWALSLDLALGMAKPTDNLSTKFTNQFLTGAGVDISFDRWILFARGSGGTGKTKESIAFGAITWNKRAKANFELPEVAIGYRTLDATRFIASPFIGVRWASIIPPEDDRKNVPGYSDIGFKTRPTPIIGMNVDFRIGKDPVYSDPYFQGYKFIRLRYTYNVPSFEREMVGFNGNIHSITVGLGASFRGSHRDGYTSNGPFKIFKSSLFRNS